MAASVHPKLGINYGWLLGESGWNTGMDDNLKTLALFTQFSFIAIADAEPASPQDGDCYIVSKNPTPGDAFDTHENAIALRLDGGWVFYTAQYGYAGVNHSDSALYYFYEFGANSEWRPVEPPGARNLRIGMNALGTMVDNELLATYVVVEPMTLKADLANSAGYAELPPTLTTNLKLQKNGVNIGTVNFAAATKSATFTFNSDVSFVAGDRLSLKAPATADAAIRDVSVTLFAEF